MKLKHLVLVPLSTLAVAGLPVISPTAAAEGHVVKLFDQAPYFQPKRLRVAVGDTVTWENHGPGLIHTVLIVTSAGEDRSGPIHPGDSWRHTFVEEAVVKTNCEVHPYMYGIVIVGDPPSSLVERIESSASSPTTPGLVIEIVEFTIPVPNSVPGILDIDSQDNVWVTLGGGGWAHIAHPPLGKFARLTPTGDVTVFSTPTPDSGPSGLLVGPDDRVYITELMAGRIARFDPRTSLIEEFVVPTTPSWPTGLDLDREGNLWFSQTKGNKVGRLGADGTIVEFPVPTENGNPTGLVIDHDGNVWIAQRDGSKIGCLKPDGTFIEYPLPTPRAKPAGMLVDRRNRVWFAQREANKIGVLESGRIREFPLPQLRSGPFFLAEDASGLIWFSQVFGNRIGVLDPDSGRIAEFSVPTPDSWPGGIAFDSQGGLWFTEQLGNKVGYIAHPTEAVRRILAQEVGASGGEREAASDAPSPHGTH